MFAIFCNPTSAGLAGWIKLSGGSVAGICRVKVAAQSEGAKLKRKSKNPPVFLLKGFLNKSLTMTYFHTGCSTIIGAKSFHGPVRDGKGWYQLAMVIRHNL